MAEFFLDGGVDGEAIGEIDCCGGVGANYEGGAGDNPGSRVLEGPGGEEIFLGEVEVLVVDSFGRSVFCHGDGGGSEVDGIMLSASLEEKAIWDDVG